MKVDEIQQIIDYAYPKIQAYYGKGKLPIPKIDTSHRNTYAMHSGEPEAEGEHFLVSYFGMCLLLSKGFILLCK